MHAQAIRIDPAAQAREAYCPPPAPAPINTADGRRKLSAAERSNFDAWARHAAAANGFGQ